MSNKDYETLTEYETSDEEIKVENFNKFNEVKVDKDEEIHDEFNEIKVNNFDNFNEIKVEDDLQLSELKPMLIEDLINRKNLKEISEENKDIKNDNKDINKENKDINKDNKDINKENKDINKDNKEESNHKEKEIIIFKNEKKIKISNRSLLLIK